jgi:hypothetical protein
MLELNAEIKQKLHRLLPEEKLKILVTPSRELRNNINNFWGIIDTLDENKLKRNLLWLKMDVLFNAVVMEPAQCPLCKAVCFGDQHV